MPAYEGGIVLDQLPAGGVEVKPGRTVYVTINSFRQKSVPVPYVAGRSLRQAKNMLEIAGLEIEELVYRPDMATNYVLEEYCDGRPVLETSRIEAEIGSGVTLYVGVEAGSETTPVPLVTGYGLREAKSRLWELGINVGRVNYDEGINLLNQKQARVYRQSPAAEQTVRLGDRVELWLTLDADKASESRAAAEKEAARLAQERIAREQAEADSLALVRFEEATSPAGGDTPADTHRGTTNDDEGFFD